MKLSHLRDVLAVSEHGSLRAAGRHLGIAQPAITRSIRDIEHELGVPLFERYAKGVRLTEMGRIFVRRAEAIQAEMRRAEEEIKQLKGQTTGQVSIALSSASSIALWPKVHSYFRKTYPDALLKISESLFPAAEPEILEGKLELYVGPISHVGASPRLLIEKIFDNDRVLIARKGHPLADATSFDDLADAHWIDTTLTMSDNTARTRDIGFEQWFKEKGMPMPKVVVHARSVLVTMLTVANSDLLAILPRQWLDYEPTASNVAPLKMFAPLPAPSVYLARRRDLPLTPMAEHLADLICRVGGNYAGRASPA